MAATTPFPVHPVYSAIAIAYTNPELIADRVMPYVTVGGEEFTYLKYTLADGFTIPDTKVGRLSEPGEVKFSATEVTAKCVDHGLQAPVPQSDIDSAPPNHDPQAVATAQTMALVKLAREKRVADIVFGASNYGTDNKITLSGSSQWSHDSSDPVAAVDAARDGMIMAPNIMVLGRAVATRLRSHPKIVAAYHGTSGSNGKVPLAYLAEIFEMEEILIGQSWLNGAKPGQTFVGARVWGKKCALLRRDKTATTSGGTTFGLTGRFGGPVARVVDVPKMGLKGGTSLIVGETCLEFVTANDLGYLFDDAVA